MCKMGSNGDPWVLHTHCLFLSLEMLSASECEHKVVGVGTLGLGLTGEYQSLKKKNNTWLIKFACYLDLGGFARQTCEECLHFVPFNFDPKW